jgi:heme/copper-type cytochrome/quinol oxidase subunit 2
MHAMAALSMIAAILAASADSNAVNVLVMISVVVPLIIVIILPFVFFRLARRNDEREALEKQAAESPPSSIEPLTK